MQKQREDRLLKAFRAMNIEDGNLYTELGESYGDETHARARPRLTLIAGGVGSQNAAAPDVEPRRRHN